MATNTPAKIPNAKRFTVGVAAEVPVTLEGAPTIIGFSLQCIDSIALRVSFTPGGTFSGDNYFTLKADYVWNERDINWTPPLNVMYVRIPVSPNGDSAVEIIYWS